MSVNHIKLFSVLFTITFFLLVLFCSTPQYGGGVETTNGITIAVKENLIQGIAPAGSRIVLCDTAYTPDIISQMYTDKFINTTYADEFGNFKLDELPDGCYNLTGRNCSADSGAIIKNISINRMNTTESMKSSVYMLLGSVSGTAYINSESTGSVLVYIRGTDLWGMTDGYGTYTIGNVPAGIFMMYGFCKTPSKIPGINEYYSSQVNNVVITEDNQVVRVDLNLEKVD